MKKITTTQKCGDKTALPVLQCFRSESFCLSAIQRDVKCSCEDISVSCGVAKAGVNEGGRGIFAEYFGGEFWDETGEGGHPQKGSYLKVEKIE